MDAEAHYISAIQGDLCPLLYANGPNTWITWFLFRLRWFKQLNEPEIDHIFDPVNSERNQFQGCTMPHVVKTHTTIRRITVIIVIGHLILIPWIWKLLYIYASVY